MTQLRAALAKYGLTEELLREQLVWQLTVLRFIDQRHEAMSHNRKIAGSRRLGEATAAERRHSRHYDGIHQPVSIWIRL